MNYEGLTLDKEAGIAMLTLNRTEQLKEISLQMAQSLGKEVYEVDKDNSLKVLIITGAGRGFCAGLDVSTFAQIDEMSQEELGDFMRILALPLYNLSKPAIAAINGVTVGAGLSIAMLCDIRIASEKARFSLGFVRMGLIPDCGATYSVPRIVGTAKAMELMISGDTLDAAEAQRMGIVNRVVPEEEVMKAAEELADRITRGPSIATELIKRAVRRSLYNTFEQQVEWENFAQYVCLRTEDHKEGVRAFFEKRPPEFKGR